LPLVKIKIKAIQSLASATSALYAQGLQTTKALKTLSPKSLKFKNKITKI